MLLPETPRDLVTVHPGIARHPLPAHPAHVVSDAFPDGALFGHMDVLLHVAPSKALRSAPETCRNSSGSQPFVTRVLLVPPPSGCLGGWAPWLNGVTFLR